MLYVFTVAAGILPAVEPGNLPGGNRVWSGKALAIWRLLPGGKMPPSTAAKMAAATYLLSTVNAYRRQHLVVGTEPTHPRPLSTLKQAFVRVL